MNNPALKCGVSPNEHLRGVRGCSDPEVSLACRRAGSAAASSPSSRSEFDEHQGVRELEEQSSSLFPALGGMNYVYGPVPSWRLGSSLGVDLLSTPKRTCSFACRYCQLGDVKAKTVERRVYAPTRDVIAEVRSALSESAPDAVTFSGMGEPTLAANLGEAVDAVHAISKVPVAVLTNASLFDRDDVRGEVGRADIVVAKFDAPDQQRLEQVNRPALGVSFDAVFAGLQRFRKDYEGFLALQMMFVEDTRDAVEDFFPLLGRIRPDEIQLNTPLRPSAVPPLSPKEMAAITDAFRKRYPGVCIRCVYEERTAPEKESEKLDTLRRRAPRHA